MNKKELIRIVTQELDLPMSQEKVALVLDKTVEIIQRTLDTGEPAVSYTHLTLPTILRV